MSAVQPEYDLSAEDVSAAAVRVLDIRGTRVRPTVTPVLADPSGVRARRLTRAGRGMAFLCLVWLMGLGLAGLGILPADDLPLGRAISGTAPGMLRVVPLLGLSTFDPAGAGATRPSAAPAGAERVADRAERIAAPWAPGGRGSASGAIGQRTTRSTTRRAGPGSSGPTRSHRPTGTTSQTVAAPSGTTSSSSHPAAGGAGRSGIHATGRGQATAPGTTVKAAAPGHTGTAPRGNSGTAPGQVRTTATTATTTPGQSGSSPSHSVSPGDGHGNGT